MTTKLHTGLLLIFTAITAATSLSGCIIETTSGPPKATCADSRYFEVYWNVAADMNAANYTCPQTPAYSHVELETSTGSYVVGRECRLTPYMGFEFDWAGRTNNGIPAGSYVIAADLVAADGVTSLSYAPGAGSQYPLPNCAPMTLAFQFDLN